MTFGYIYKIPFPNGKHYIGLTTTSFEQRTKEHKILAKNGDVRIMYKALRKYEMVDSFELIEIDTATTFEELCEKEIGYILEYNSYYGDGYGYNMTRGGEGMCGYVHTEETRQRISKAHKKYHQDNPDARIKNSEAQKKYYEDNTDARLKNSEAQKKYNREHPESMKERGELKIKYYQDHPEALKKKSEQMHKYYAENPNVIEKQSQISKQRWESAEKRQKMSDTKKQYYKDNPDARREIQDAKGKNKPFDVFTIDGTLIGTFTYQYEAKEFLQREYDIDSINTSSVLSGNTKQSAGFVFKYKTI